MSTHRSNLRLRLIYVLAIATIAAAGCVCGKVPCFKTDASVRDACQGQTPRDHTITVDDDGGVGSENCVVIRRDHPRQGNWVHWVPKNSGHHVSIIFILGPGQQEPFENMACGKPDSHGSRLCPLLDCPGPCKTVFNAGYSPSQSEYYFYSAVGSGVLKKKAGAEKSGGDPGIRIDP